MEEKKREENRNPTNSSSTTTTMTFSDDIPTTTNTTLFPFQPSISTFFDTMSSSDQKASSFGFMDMLGSHDYINNNFLLSDWGLPTVATSHHPLPLPVSSNVPAESASGTLNTPVSPNSTSISSSSNEATVNESLEHNRSKVSRNENDAEVEEDVNGGRGDEQDQDKSKKQ
ncbi:hypothetical protein TSUD_313750 [Trifolium subterraneum]|uniref:WRKY domain-containing protein n=1 Tax=Trifolium subterraneum TaxID=3900 RepID=A0A2Z6MAE5_TRISU|nr:hypothetical protein TSUD_313750 [Trifolium subterraneum]